MELFARIIVTLLLTLIYTILGIVFEKHNIITKPANWAFYGVIFGALFAFAI